MICEGCGATFGRKPGPGRPRRFCLTCSPTDPAECTAAWRARKDARARRKAVEHAEMTRAEMVRQMERDYAPMGARIRKYQGL